MEASAMFEVVDAVTWGELKLDPGQFVSEEEVGNRLDMLIVLGALTPVSMPVGASFGQLA